MQKRKLRKFLHYTVTVFIPLIIAMMGVLFWVKAMNNVAWLILSPKHVALDDANGYGYKSILAARKGYGYKRRNLANYKEVGHESDKGSGRKDRRPDSSGQPTFVRKFLK